MGSFCVWSEEALTSRHPRYAAFFARRDRSRSVTSTPQSRVAHSEDREEASEALQLDNTDRISTMTRPRGQSSPPPPLPAAPHPFGDAAVHEVNAKVIQEQEEQEGSGLDSDTEDMIDIRALRPAQALELLCIYVQSLLKGSGHKLPKPPTPPSSGSSSSAVSPTPTPGPADENKRLLVSVESHLAPPGAAVTSPGPTSPQHPFLQRVPRASRTPIDSPVSHPQSPIPPTRPVSPSPLEKDKDTTTQIIAQSDKLARKFYCKSAPPVTLQDYLTRLHKFCPMSVAVYLAAGVYIDRLTRRRAKHTRRGSFLPLTPVSSNPQDPASIIGVLGEKPKQKSNDEEAPMVEVTPKSVHRLLLAALRVANKALEDGVFPHRRVALVGGVSELELARLEVSMCFLTHFELVLSARDMERWVRKVRMLSEHKVQAETEAARSEPD